MISIRFATPGLSGARRTSRPESVTALLTFLRITSGGSAMSTVPIAVPPVVDILFVRLLQIHDPRADLGVLAVRKPERLAEALVEARSDIPRELEVLALVVADRDEVGLVEQDVARHQDGVREQAGRDELLLLALVLELRHPAQLAEARDRAQQPGRLGVRLDVALGEGRRPVGVEAAREQHRRQVDRRLAQILRVVVDRDRVQVDDAEERPRRAPAWRRTGGNRRCSCRGASARWAGCRRRCACSLL